MSTSSWFYVLTTDSVTSVNCNSCYNKCSILVTQLPWIKHFNVFALQFTIFVGLLIIQTNQIANHPFYGHDASQLPAHPVNNWRIMLVQLGIDYWLYKMQLIWCNYTHPFNGPFSVTTRVSRYQKGKTNLWILLKQGTLSGSGISWDICKSATRSRQR